MPTLGTEPFRMDHGTHHRLHRSRQRSVGGWVRAATVAAAVGAQLCLGAGCGGGPRHRPGPLPYPAAPSTGAAAVARMVYASQLAPLHKSPLRSDEFGTVSVDARRGLVYSGGRHGYLLASDDRDGRVVWELSLGAAIHGPPLLVGPNLLLCGTDGGALVAIDLDDRTQTWRYETSGTIRTRPVVHDDVVFFANSRDQVFALDVRTGAWRWQYQRELPQGFSIQGRAGLAFVAARDLASSDLHDDVGVLLTGFADGRAVALSAVTGEALWITDLSPAGEDEFVDVDATPLVDVAAGEVLVTGQATGVHALSLVDGEPRWRLPMRGAGPIVRTDAHRYLVASSIEGLVAFDRGGHVRWRRQLDPGVVGVPVVAGQRIFVSHSESGLLVYGSDRGEFLGGMDVGSGVSGGLSLHESKQRLYLTTNRGMLLALDIGG